MTKIKIALLLSSFLALSTVGQATEEKIRKACFRIAPSAQDLLRRENTQVLCRVIYFDRLWYGDDDLAKNPTVTFTLLPSENQIIEGPEQLPFQQKLVLKSLGENGKLSERFYADNWVHGTESWKATVRFYGVSDIETNRERGKLSLGGYQIAPKEFAYEYIPRWSLAETCYRIWDLKDGSPEATQVLCSYQQRNPAWYSARSSMEDIAGPSFVVAPTLDDARKLYQANRPDFIFPYSASRAADYGYDGDGIGYQGLKSVAYLDHRDWDYGSGYETFFRNVIAFFPGDEAPNGNVSIKGKSLRTGKTLPKRMFRFHKIDQQ